MGVSGATADGPTCRTAAVSETPLPQVALEIERVASKASEWAALPPGAKKALLVECLARLQSHREQLVAEACAARGYDIREEEQGHLVADATIMSTMVVGAWLRGGVRLLEALEKTGRPPAGRRAVPRPDGTWRVRVGAGGPGEELMSDGAGFQLVVRSGGSEPVQYNPMDSPPSVTGVLGAGNTEILNDIIDPLCRLNSVVVYKANPVMAGPNRVKASILAPLINRGYLSFVYGGIEQGRALTESSKVDRILLTGSQHTYDAIVWGGRDKSDPKEQPAATKPVLAELGSVSPYVVVPGDSPWTVKEIEAQAEALVAYKLLNASHVCASPQVLVTCRHWPQRDEFLRAVKRRLASAPSARCFYPGAERSYARHLEAAGGRAVRDEAWAPIFREDVSASGDATFGLRDEAFCPALYEVAIDSSPSFKDFMSRVTDFCNDELWGNLSCTVVVDDRTLAKHRADFDTCLDAMRFGTIGVNFPAASANYNPALPWGGFPGNDSRDIQSGTGQVGNFCCYVNVEKSIVFQRFRNLQSFALAESPRERALAKARAHAIAKMACGMSVMRVAKVGAAQMKMKPSHTMLAMFRA